MDSWALYPVFIGTVISMFGWGYFVLKRYDNSPKTLSELAAISRENILYFRLILWICGPLFVLTAIFYMAHRLPNQFLLWLWLATVVLEILVGVFPPINQRQKFLHEVIAYSMAAFMFATGAILAITLPGLYGTIEWLLVGAMVIFALAGLLHRNKFVYYELGFIFASHLTMVVATIAVS